MDSVGNDIARESRVGEHLGKDSWIAMVERPHRIECVRSVPRSRRNRSACRIQIRIRVSQADADFPPGSLRDYLARAFQLRRNGHDANMATRRLPEPVERR